MKNHDRLQNIVCQWPQMTKSNSYWAGICALVEMWKETVHKDGHCIEKDNYASSYIVVKICEIFTCVNCKQHKV